LYAIDLFPPGEDRLELVPGETKASLARGRRNFAILRIFLLAIAGPAPYYEKMLNSGNDFDRRRSSEQGYSISELRMSPEDEQGATPVDG
jgi:hypothetical protein